MTYPLPQKIIDNIAPYINKKGEWTLNAFLEESWTSVGLRLVRHDSLDSQEQGYLILTAVNYITGQQEKTLEYSKELLKYGNNYVNAGFYITALFANGNIFKAICEFRRLTNGQSYLEIEEMFLRRHISYMRINLDIKGLYQLNNEKLPPDIQLFNYEFLIGTQFDLKVISSLNLSLQEIRDTLSEVIKTLLSLGNFLFKFRVLNIENQCVIMIVIEETDSQVIDNILKVYLSKNKLNEKITVRFSNNQDDITMPITIPVDFDLQEMEEAVEAPSVLVPKFNNPKELLQWMKNLKKEDFSE